MSCVRNDIISIVGKDNLFESPRNIREREKEKFNTDKKELSEFEAYYKDFEEKNTKSIKSFQRVVSPGDRIDYFVSHTALDSDGKKKKIEIVSKKKSDETFWIDQFCFDQNDLSDGLSYLPIHIARCDKMVRTEY